MDIKDIIALLKARWSSLLAFTLLGLLLAGAVTALTPQSYSSNTTALVSAPLNQGAQSNPTANYANNNLAQAKIPSYLQLGSTRTLAQYAIDELNLQTSPEQLLQQVKVSHPAQSLLIRIDTQAESAQQAQELAQVWAEGLALEINRLETGSEQTRGDLYLLVQDSASLPTSPLSPNLKLNLLVGLLLGLLAGLAFALLRERLDRTMSSPAKVEQISGLKVLGTLPQAADLSSGNRLYMDIARPDSPAPISTLAESTRSLRTNLQFTAQEQAPRVLLVTSPQAGEGKTTLAANLALSLALTGTPTVLIDADYRDPAVALTFGQDLPQGLTEVLAGKASFDEVTITDPSSSYLYLLSTGQLVPNPSDLLSSQAMADLLAELRSSFMVVIDAPASLEYTDALALSAATDGTLLVLDSRSKIDSLLKTQARFARTQGKLLGLVLNHQNPKNFS
ncbi:MAG: polysaccharide biosynthesis tyrosine autokinase [Rothia sp. (in: high G+C Gram-positive bacteria)]|nr:polysaccharide biosynthesis tyrosine autokinase [Rothia sp. (in: high G+C Gram-positive bacteria)]